MSKEVQKKRYNTNLKLSIFLLLKKQYTPKQICSKFNLKMNALSYYLKQLKESGSIKKLGYGVWEALEYQTKEVQKIKVGNLKTHTDLKFSKKDNRGHAFAFKIQIPRLYNWINREKYLKKKKIDYKVINKGYTHRIMFRDCKTWLNEKSIVVYFPQGLSFFGKTAQDSEDRALYEMIDIMKGLENLFNVSFRINKQYKIRCFRKHQANIKNALARMYNDNNRKLTIYNEDGQWLLIDDSFSLEELETIGSKGKNDATKDMDNVIKPFFNSLKEKPFTAYDFESLFKLTNKHAENQEMYAENIKLHLEVMKEIKDTLKEIKEIATKK